MNNSDANKLKNKALETIRRERLIDKGDNVLVALSGGADSMTLLLFLIEYKERLGIKSLSAAHINHCLRGQESFRDQEFVTKECKRLGMPLFIHSVDVAAQAEEQREGLEEAGRRIRYSFLSDKAAELNACIATAHTLSDSIESLLLNMVRGSGMRGLCGIPPMREIVLNGKGIKVIRPLIDCTRTEVEAYCHTNEIDYINDSTNWDTSFTRNRIRARVIPELKVINPNAEAAFSRLMRSITKDIRFIEDTADALLDEAAINDGYGGYNAASLFRLPPAIRTRALIAAVRRVDADTSRSLTEKKISIMESILETGGALTLSDKFEYRVSQGRMLISPLPQKSELTSDKIPIEIGISCLFYGRIYRPTLITLDCFKKRQKIHKNLFKYSLNYDKISNSLYLRNRRPGDAFRPAGRGVKKTLKKLFGEEKIPAGLRDEIPVVCDALGIVLVGGLGCDERVLIDESCRQVLVLEKE
ncbi:MAG: tRNA lysidine(34) synthetase TilS [Oscillospiraceae bacterium]|nr:tRNA lysidine(34) synthetase TilS [Oscillospiraceae bacterium]MDD4413636.1 tRNA lysidine(34) synthetase TilS [Oscillospiraceae bacterium]